MKRTKSPAEPSLAALPTGVSAGEVFDHGAAGYEDAVDRSISFTGRNASFFAERKVDLLDELLRSQGRS